MKMPANLIREEISKSGAISFARFMELALYCPETGYYERNRDNVGRTGDFITSVSVGSLFGELLAFQFSRWLEEIKNPGEKLKIIEAGAHDGKLANDILNWLQKNRSELFSQIEYVILEPSKTRQQWQREKLKNYSNVVLLENFEKLKNQKTKIEGVIFSNELLDAFPIHRFGWNKKDQNWFEFGVALESDRFVWTKISPTILSTYLSNLPTALQTVLPDNYTVEFSPAAENWWRDAAETLSNGKLLAIDYGFTTEGQFSPARTNGTLRAYHKHQVSHDLLANVGEQDLTAHVNFSAIQKVGEDVGLKTKTFCTQPQFLTHILSDAMKRNYFSILDAKQIRQFQTLTHPDHLGRAFKTLVQSR
jgi:SAM-dependent MidA family methyltransferase